MPPQAARARRPGRPARGGRHPLRGLTTTGSDAAGLLSALGAGRGGLVAVVGAGGKTSLIGSLARAGRAAGLRVIVSCTTHMGAPGPGSAGPLLLACSGGADAALDRALAEHGWATLLGRCERPDKYAGIGCAEADALRSRADLVLVEADGARGRSLKAPAAHEPVVPPASDVVVVVAGLDALGAALDAGLVHRLERVCALTGRPPGAPVDEDVLVGTLSLGGYPERSPAAARTVVFLNKAEDESREAAARRVARRLVPPYAAVLAGSARAGRGRRLA